jgi:predicted methyltransferase
LGLAACPTQAPTQPPEPVAVAPEAAARPDEAPAEAAPPEREESVKPGINDAWKSEDVDPLVGRLEAEDREVYVHREAIVEAVVGAGAEPGTVVADIGSGSGFLTAGLAKAVGPEGKVYAVDINEKLLDKVRARAEAEGVENIEPVLTPDDAVALDPGSVDLLFICDAYHHFEFPKTILAGLHDALKPGGKLVIIDFERIEGETEQWIMDHVRAGQDEVTREITAAGFRATGALEIEGLEQNYTITFARD